MIKAHEDVLYAALALPAEARAELAERLLTSLDSSEQAAIDAVSSKEVEHRIGQLDRGEVQLIPGDAVIANLRTRCK